MKRNLEKIIISGTPLIGEGNILDNMALIHVLKASGMPSIGFYPNGLFVRLGRMFHIGMSMNTRKTMDYAVNSEAKRGSLKVLPLKWELKLAIIKAYKLHPNAVCFITSQSMMAEESIGIMDDCPTIMASSDQSGKFNPDSIPSVRQKEIHYLVWNREALDLYKNGLNLRNVSLSIPIDPKDAFRHIKRAELPFQEELNDPKICFIKLSGSGGDPVLINKAISSLWKNSRVRSIVFPGTEKTRKKIIERVSDTVKIGSSLESAVFYNHAREIISDEQMLLTYPSEQVKHIAVLTYNNVFPKVVWLPPRGEHELNNLAWIMNKGFSGMVCIPQEYRYKIKTRLIDLGVSPSIIEFVSPERLSAEHFKLSPKWQYEKEADLVENIVSKLLGNF